MDVTRISHQGVTPVQRHRFQLQLTALDLAQPFFTGKPMTSSRCLEGTVFLGHVNEGKVERQDVGRRHQVGLREQRSHIAVKLLVNGTLQRRVTGVAANGRIIAVVQPHRFTRLRDLFEDFCTGFNDADTVVVANVHAAGEAAIEGFDRDALVAGLTARGHRRVLPLDDPEDLPALIAGEAASGDMVVCLGAGTITAWANALPERLAPLLAEPKLAGGVA